VVKTIGKNPKEQSGTGLSKGLTSISMRKGASYSPGGGKGGKPSKSKRLQRKIRLKTGKGSHDFLKGGKENLKNRMGAGEASHYYKY